MQNYGFRDKSEKHSNKNNLDFLAMRLQSYCSLFKHRGFFYNEYFDERDYSLSLDNYAAHLDDI